MSFAADHVQSSSGPSPTKRKLAKALGIKLDNSQEGEAGGVTRGESIQSTDTYVEDEPTVKEWIQSIKPTGSDVKTFVSSLFPFTHWIGRYNLLWFYGDLIAGITVGMVVVPQSMAYASLALLAPEFGLYSSFVGVIMYWFFATSKDITIGPVAVMSTLTGNIVKKAAVSHPDIPANVVASSLAVICGCIVFALGFFRLGFIVDFIPLPAIAAFMTGSALNIAMGQVPGLFGIKDINNRAQTYKVFINFWHHINHSRLDAALGLTALFLLYIIRYSCTKLAARIPKQQRTFFFLSTLRTAFVILLYTLVSWLVNRHHRKKPKFKILGHVPRGFKHMGVPTLDKDIISSYASDLPAAVIVLLIEHIAISKSFGRVNGYTINPSQELIAIGITNIFGPFFGAYPATGSFSRTAIKSKAGVRTPLAGVITGLLVLLAIYALPAVFFYIPNASLAAVIIHAVGDLITPPNTLYRFWRVSPIEVMIYFAGVIVTVFSSIENGIYVTIATSGALLLWRIAKARGHFLGRVKVHSVIGDNYFSGDKLPERSQESLTANGGGQKPGALAAEDKTNAPLSDASSAAHDEPDHHHGKGKRHVYLPLDHYDGSNPEISLDSPYPGIFVFRFTEGYLYPNANHYTDQLVERVFKATRRTNPNSYARLGDRPWNDPGPRKGPSAEELAKDTRPTLKAIILDFASVNHVDITSVQILIDVRNQLDKHASPDRVDWHFASVNNRWTKRALASAGFGYPSDVDGTGNPRARWRPVFSVAEIGASGQGLTTRNEAGRVGGNANGDSKLEDIEAAHQPHGGLDATPKRLVAVNSINRPMFHIDMDAALTSAIENATSQVVFP